MDEIITRWATDLTKYQKEFKEQASKVSEWDRLLVDNGEKIQKLFTSTYEAERASHEIERQLSTVESQQDELAEWLDRYESEVDELSAKQQLGAPSSMGGPDQERDRTYRLAEKLTDRLDEMGQDLSKMIKEINEMSGTLSKGNKPDDPVSSPRPNSCYIADTNTRPLVESNCSRSQWPSGTAPMDRHQRCCASGQGLSRAEVEQQNGQWQWAGERCCGELLPVVHGTKLGFAEHE